MGTDALDVTTIVLDTPENRNALSAATCSLIAERLAFAASDPAIRCVTLTHTGSTFCAGADLAEAATEGGPTLGTRRLVEVLRAMVVHPKPIIGVINGHVRAGGLGLLGACDVVVAGPKSTFALSESRLGLAPAIISLTLASKLDPRAWARYALGGEVFDSEEAVRIGLISQACDDPESLCEEYLAAYRLASPQGLAATKRLVNAPVIASFDTSAESLVQQSAELFASPEAQEGIAAFRERRIPRWAQ